MTIHSVAAVTPLRQAENPRADKREAILRAATDVFAERGFFNAQVADVARAAGVAAGTVYLYFHGKDDLLVSIFEKTMREAIADGRACVAPLDDPIEQLRAIGRVHLDRMGRDRSLAVVFQVELRQSTKFMERFSATLAAKLFFGGLDEMATNWILSTRKYSLASQADAIVDLFVGGVAKTPTRLGKKR